MEITDEGGIFATGAPNPVGPYPHARRVGNLLFLSGVGPRSSIDDSIPEDFAGQCHAVMRNVSTILAQSGADFASLVDVTVFLTNMRRDFESMNELYGAYFRASRPCRTTVEVTRLPTEIDIELKCIAHIDSNVKRG